MPATLSSWRGVADVNVRAGSNTRYSLSKSDERNAARSQEVYNDATFRAVRVQSDINPVSMIEPKPIVQGRLAERANGQGATKF